MTFSGNYTALRIYFTKELLSLTTVYWQISFSFLLLVRETYDFQRQMAKDEGLCLSPEPWARAVGTIGTIFLPQQCVHREGGTQRPPEDPTETAQDTAHLSKQLPSSREVQGAGTVPVYPDPQILNTQLSSHFHRILVSPIMSPMIPQKM